MPFVAKAMGVPFAKLAARVMAGERLADLDLTVVQRDHVAVKEAVFPFARFPGVDTVLGPEMRSTGEVMGLASTFPLAFAKSQLGFKIIATSGTQRFLEAGGVPSTKINKVLEGRPHIVDAIKNGEVQLVINTTEGAQALADSRSLRRAALLHRVPYYTTVAGAEAAARGIEAWSTGVLEVRPLQSYFATDL